MSCKWNGAYQKLRLVEFSTLDLAQWHWLYQWKQLIGVTLAFR